MGGKVHGSLARAGKVKGQTPKVEKQVKKRKKCGRARRRILYQKRFLNVVNVPGKFKFEIGILSMILWLFLECSRTILEMFFNFTIRIELFQFHID